MTVFIKSRTHGFRRCGVAHSAEGREFPDDFFSEDQIKILNDDPDIIVIAGVPEDDGSEKDSGKGGQDTDPPLDPQGLIDAAKKAIKAGNTIKSGAPSVEAMEDILGRKLTMEDRNQAWMAIQAEKE